tara:strand:- start:46349 stop:46837 length:489 start_codon:yes stop_codon:yes gene_type:complete
MTRTISNKNIPCLSAIECNFCGKILGRKATLLEHIQDIHKKTKKIICTVGNCNYKTNRIGNYNLHLEKVHKITLPITQCYTPGCGKRSRNEPSLIKHMRKCKGNPLIKTIRCTEENCKEEFLTEKGLKNHLIIKHNLLTGEENEERFFIEKFYREVDELLCF